jgi:aminoglycoside phosphotransferase (APT) family kinase protein
MYSRRTGRITGIIDWEHAVPAALPLIDALYLLFYNRILQGSPWIDVLGSIVDRAQLDERENRLIEDYLASIGMPASYFPALAAVFLAHHIGRRITLAPDAETIARLRRILSELGARISAPHPQARISTSS